MLLDTLFTPCDKFLIQFCNMAMSEHITTYEMIAFFTLDIEYLHSDLQTLNFVHLGLLVLTIRGHLRFPILLVTGCPGCHPLGLVPPVWDLVVQVTNGC